MTGMRTPMNSQRGVAAVELALVLPVLIALLTLPVFFGIYFMHHTVVQKAAQSAARYMSTVRKTEIRSPMLAAAATDAAKGVARETLADYNLAQGASIDIDCDTWECLGGNALPTHVRVMVTYRIRDDIFGLINTGDYGWAVKAQVTMKYAGQ